MIHHIKISSFPNWSGQNQARNYSFNGYLLTLSADPINSRIHQLVWKKMVPRPVS
ncbi:MAG: lipocalin-like domain-containing protein [Lewinellaceae bacterium]|nr:lipocalin-like domain-containing protein [Saprospiraceae bacterium]MCB9268170.1 lipocalin-like domain-containing protein [Lewinellaceae bacterium]